MFQRDLICPCERLHIFIAACWFFRKGVQYDLFDLCRNKWLELAHGGRWCLYMSMHDGVEIACKWRTTCEQLITGHCQRILIAGSAWLFQPLLRCGIERGANIAMQGGMGIAF